MGDPLKKVQAGDPLVISAGAYNEFCDAAKAAKAGAMSQGSAAGNGTGFNPSIVLVKNNSGADRDRFDVLGIDAPLFTFSDSDKEFKTRPSLKGVSPTLADHLGKFVILLEPVASGKIGRAAISGLVPCKVKIESGQSSLQYADIEADTMTRLILSSGGTAQVLWKVSDEPGDQWALVRLGAGGTSTPDAWYVLMSPIDNDTIQGYACPTTLNSTTKERTIESRFLNAETNEYVLDEDGVIVVYATEPLGAWPGDVIAVKSLGDTLYVEEYTKTYDCYQITKRSSPQLVYPGFMPASGTLPAGGSVSGVTIAINGRSFTRDVHDNILSAGNSIDATADSSLGLVCSYSPNDRKWYCIGAACPNIAGV
jgi:hypothetical protein